MLKSKIKNVILKTMQPAIAAQITTSGGSPSKNWVIGPPPQDAAIFLESDAPLLWYMLSQRRVEVREIIKIVEKEVPSQA